MDAGVAADRDGGVGGALPLNAMKGLGSLD